MTSQINEHGIDEVLFDLRGTSANEMTLEQCHLTAQIISDLASLSGQGIVEIIEGIINNTLENFFENYFVRMEGSAFSADKAAHVLSQIISSISERKELSLLDHYKRDEDNPKMDPFIEQLTYWSPRTLSDTGAAKKLYLAWAHFDLEELAYRLSDADLNRQKHKTGVSNLEKREK